MRKLLFSLTIASFVFLSCNKESSKTRLGQEAALQNKFHLQKLATDDTSKVTKRFASFEELEVYLKKQEASLLDTSNFKQLSEVEIVRKTNKAQSRDGGLGAVEPGELEGDNTGAGGYVSYRVITRSEYYKSHGFPNLTILYFAKTGNAIESIDLILTSEGATIGEFEAQIPSRSGFDHGNGYVDIRCEGVYTEIYEINMVKYRKPFLYSYKINHGNLYSTSMPVLQTFTPM